MAKIVKEHPGNAPRLDGQPGEYEWPEGGETVEVDDATAVHILRIPGFSEFIDPRDVRRAEKVKAEPVAVVEPTFTGPRPVTEPAPAPAQAVAETDTAGEPGPEAAE